MKTIGLGEGDVQLIAAKGMAVEVSRDEAKQILTDLTYEREEDVVSAALHSAEKVLEDDTAGCAFIIIKVVQDAEAKGEDVQSAAPAEDQGGTRAGRMAPDQRRNVPRRDEEDDDC